MDEKSNGFDAPMVVGPSGGEHGGHEGELGEEETRKFRRIAALVSYIAHDRLDTQVAVSPPRQDMSKPA